MTLVTPWTLLGDADRVPEELRVVVRVRVDEARGHDEPGARRSTRSAGSSISPTATIRPSWIPTSPGRAGAPVPSTSVPPRITMSSMASSLSCRASPDLTGRQITHPPPSRPGRSACGAGLRWMGRQSICCRRSRGAGRTRDQIAPVPPTSPSRRRGRERVGEQPRLVRRERVETRLHVDARRVALACSPGARGRPRARGRVEHEQAAPRVEVRVGERRGRPEPVPALLAELARRPRAPNRRSSRTGAARGSPEREHRVVVREPVLDRREPLRRRDRPA